jgi:hypothetical protein
MSRIAKVVATLVLFGGILGCSKDTKAPPAPTDSAHMGAPFKGASGTGQLKGRGANAPDVPNPPG